MSVPNTSNRLGRRRDTEHPDPPAVLAIDGHHHFWRSDVAASWMQGDYAPLRRRAMPEDVSDALQAAGVEAVVAVQADDTLQETEFLQDLASDPGSHVAGVVGWLPLDDPDRLEDLLDRLRTRGALHGVRHQSHLQPDPDWLIRPEVVESVTYVGSRDVVVDLVAVGTDQVTRCITLAERVPNTVFVLDHLGKPDIAGGQWTEWASQMEALAALPNVRAKVSGLDTCAGWGTWTAADIARYVDHVVGAFGPERTLAGSDWPVASLASSYTKVWSEVRAVLARHGADVEQAVVRRTAISTYRLALT